MYGSLLALLLGIHREFYRDSCTTTQPHSTRCRVALGRGVPGSFRNLKLMEAPVLVYPDFNLSFTLETDASYNGLGAVLSRKLDDHRLHSVAFVSRALSPPEKNYAVTELETLVVVWSFKQFHAYLYRHDVEVVTDHSVVKALLAAPSPSGKHAHWWLQV